MRRRNITLVAQIVAVIFGLPKMIVTMSASMTAVIIHPLIVRNADAKWIKKTMTKTVEQAAREFADREYEVGEIDWDALYKGYCWGAKDTLSQPLADRLTAAEKEKVRALYNGETFGELDFIELVSCRRVLECIFGTGIFQGNTPRKIADEFIQE